MNNFGLRKRHRIFIPLAFCSVLVLVGGIAQGAVNIVVNPSFEDPVVLGSDSIFSISAGSPAGTLPGWSVTGTPSFGIDLKRVGNPYSIGPAADGMQFIDLDGSPGPGQISQMLAVDPNTYYTLSFSYSNNYAGPRDAGFVEAALVEVLDGTTELLGGGAGAVVTHNTAAPGNLDWITFSETFHTGASTTEVMLQFSSQTTQNGHPFHGNFGILLDNVSVVDPPSPSGNPEASSLAIWCGLAVVAVLSAQKRAR